MVVKMMKWSPWLPASPSKKFQVKVKPLELHGFDFNLDLYDPEVAVEEEKEAKMVTIEMKWRGPKPGLVPLRRPSSKHRRNVSTPVVVGQGQVIQWDDEFENVCSFSIFQRDNSFHPWDVSFNLLHGRCSLPTNKLALMGSVSLNIAELASLMEPQIERKLPVTVRVAGVSGEATLLISVSFVEIRNSQDSSGVVRDSAVSSKEDGFLRMVKDLTSYVYVSKNKKKKKSEEVDEGEMSNDNYSGHSDDSVSDSEESPDVSNKLCQKSNESLDQCSTASTGNRPETPTKDNPLVFYDNGNHKDNSSETRLKSLPTQVTETRLGSASKIGFLPWKKRRLSSVSAKGKEKPLIKKSKADQKTNETSTVEWPSKSKFEDDEDFSVGRWEDMEVMSRDGQAKLKANVFFASIDQRSEKAAGESACTALVTVIADWLHSNRDTMPSRSEFDNLIKDGSSEWRKLCDNELYIQRFPDKHFDLETMLEVELRPVSIKPEKSFVGFFCPDKFESLKGAMCFDGIWNEISSSSSNLKEDEGNGVYIVSWNDHFFVLKVETHAYYIIDTLGERLFEGCNKAYILKFDDTACLYNLPQIATTEGSDTEGRERERESLVCSGKESCREYIKRFLAAIPLKELEMEEEKGTVSIVPLHQRLQIEFHLTSPSTSSSSSSSLPISLSSPCHASSTSSSLPSLSSPCHASSTSSSSSSSSTDEYEE